MLKIPLIAEVNDVEDFSHFTKEQDISVTRKPSLRLNPDQVIHYLTFGGGFIALAKCILDYLKLKYQKRIVTIKDKTGKELTVEGLSVEEVVTLLETAETIHIKKIKNIKAEIV